MAPLEDEPLAFIVADGLTLGDHHGQLVLVMRKAGMPTLGIALEPLHRAALAAALRATDDAPAGSAALH